MTVMKSIRTLLSSLVCISLCFSSVSSACTRVLIANKGPAVMVGRNMDWFEDMQTNLWVFPQGLNRDGVAPGNSLRWTSKYGSLVAMAYDMVTTDGVNEKGLAAHLLSLHQSDYGARDAQIPGMSIAFWAQFYLDNFATVAEAVTYSETHPLQIIPYFEPRINKWINLHLVLDDASGDSAIIEYIDGKIHIYHDKAYTTVTNDPTYEQQLANAKLYTGLGGDKPLPGTTDPMDRFVRASYAAINLPETKSARTELASILSIIQNAAAPYGTSSPERLISIPTIWRVVADLTNRVYYFNATNKLNMIFVNIAKLNFQANAGILKLDMVHHPELSGDVTTQFQATGF